MQRTVSSSDTMGGTTAAYAAPEGAPSLEGERGQRRADDHGGDGRGGRGHCTASGWPFGPLSSARQAARTAVCTVSGSGM